MDNDDKGLGIGSTGKELSKAFKEGTLFSKPDTMIGGTGYAPNADQMKPIDDTDDLQKIAEGADPEAVKKASAEAKQANAYNPLDYENQRSQSVIYSQREITEQQLAEVRARNEAALREQQRIAAEDKAKRVSFKIGIGIFIGVLVVVAIIMAIVIVSSIRTVVTPPEPEPEDPPMPLSTVDGYSCETQICGKVTDLPDGRIILRDNAYYIYNTQTKERESTTIDNQDYIDVYSFKWGEKTYVTLDPTSNYTALYSVDENRYAVTYAYDKYYTSIQDSVYNDMHQIEGSYIVASVGGTLKIVNLTNGQPVASGKTRVFTHDGYYFGYEEGNRIYIYTQTGKTITTITQDADNRVFTRDGRLIVVKESFDVRLYDQSGEEIGDDPIYDEIFDSGYDEYIGYITKNNQYYQIPLE